MSRKVHGNAGTFDIGLPLAGTPGIECRSGGATNDYQIVVTFGGPVTFSNAQITKGTGSVSSTTTNGSQVFINLTGVNNAQTIQITLLGVNDGTSTVNVTIPMSILLGDVNGNGVVSNGDVSLVQAQVAQKVTSFNFREDVNANGILSNGDVSITKAQVGQTLP